MIDDCDKMTKEKMDLLFPKSWISRFNDNLTVRTIYGIIWFGSGLINWWGDGLRDYLLLIEISPMFATLLVGIQLCLGYYFLSTGLSFNDVKRGLHLNRNVI